MYRITKKKIIKKMISTCFLPPVFVISLQCIPINRSRDEDFIIFWGGNWSFSVTCLEAVCLRTNEIPQDTLFM